MEIAKHILYEVESGIEIRVWEKMWLMKEAEPKSIFGFEQFLIKIMSKLVNSVLMKIIVRCRPHLSSAGIETFMGQIMMDPSCDDLENAIRIGYKVDNDIMERYFANCKDESYITDGLCIAARHGIELRNHLQYYKPKVKTDMYERFITELILERSTQVNSHVIPALSGIILSYL